MHTYSTSIATSACLRLLVRLDYLIFIYFDKLLGKKTDPAYLKCEMICRIDKAYLLVALASPYLIIFTRILINLLFFLNVLNTHFFSSESHRRISGSKLKPLYEKPVRPSLHNVKYC